jgi:hypothetical protein
MKALESIAVFAALLAITVTRYAFHKHTLQQALAVCQELILCPPLTTPLAERFIETHMAAFRDISAIDARIKGLTEWLEENAPECFTEQRHIREGTQERVYWHYGYMVALRDMLRFLTESPNRDARTRDRSDSRSAA